MLILRETSPWPFKDVKELLKGTILMLDNMDPYFADCIASMDEMGHLDLDSKKGKSQVITILYMKLVSLSYL